MSIPCIKTFFSSQMLESSQDLCLFNFRSLLIKNYGKFWNIASCFSLRSVLFVTAIIILQGDVIGIIDDSGNPVLEYKYDA